MQFDERIEKSIQEICNTHQVKRLELFGSILTDHFKEESDIDFLVEFNDSARPTLFQNYFELKEKLKNLFKREVDIVMKTAVKNPYFMQSLQNSQLVYEA